MVEYQDRLGMDKTKKLREICGGELGWKRRFPRLSKEDKARFGEIVFGEPVKNIRVTTEKNVATGYDIPVITAEAI